jgi:undecaprenyl-phosphate galactose phosphotransferase
MHADADERLEELLSRDEEARLEWDTHFKLKDDPRVTVLGEVLRKSSLDELPQLFNVLKGDMSLVGPRPVVEEELKLYGNYASDYLSARPGITGLWQVSGRNDLDYNERVSLDVTYVRQWTHKLDLRILLKTVLVVLTRRGAY